MSSDGVKINFPLFFIGVLGLAVGLCGMIALAITQSMIIGTPFTVMGFTVFVTAMMMCAKTTGGVQD
jgi:hypothetical protein